MAAYEAPFAQLIAQAPRSAPIVCARGFEPLRRLLQGRAVTWYGANDGPGWGAERIRPGETTRFDLVTPSGRRIELETPLLGRHNIENIVGAAAFLLERGMIDEASLVRGVRGFRGLERRLDRKTTASRIPVYEGFGSSYEKARSAIDAVALHFPHRRILVVFEPHAFSWRSRDSLGWYDTIFRGVSEVVLLPPPAHGAQTHGQLDAATILARTRAAGVRVHPAADAEQALAAVERLVEEHVEEDVVVLLLSSGPLAGLPQTLPARLEALYPT
jgi:UDP-N-acetylmuramate: L-alanyl-gamma-D-glutamyl-meso-diaminopimelate ligase